MKYAAFTVLLLFASVTHAETWECKAVNPNTGYVEGRVVVRAMINDDRETGKIDVADTKYDTKYKVDGFNRQWDFGDLNGKNRFSFIIQPSGLAHYYDFSMTNSDGAVSNIQIFGCRNSLL